MAPASDSDRASRSSLVTNQRVTFAARLHGFAQTRRFPVRPGQLPGQRRPGRDPDIWLTSNAISQTDSTTVPASISEAGAVTVEQRLAF